MATYSQLMPFPKKGAITYYMPGDFATPSAFLAFLNQNTFTESAQVVLEIANGTVLSEPFILEGDYSYLTIKAAGTVYVDSNTLPLYQPFPPNPYYLPFFIYNRWLEYAFSGRPVPKYGLGGIHGKFQKTGTNPAVFCFAAVEGSLQLGLTAFSIYGTEVPLEIVDFEQAGLFGADTVNGVIRTTCPSPQTLPVSFGAYFSIQGRLGTSVSIEPYGNVVVQNNLGEFLSFSGYKPSVTIYTGATPFDITTPTFAAFTDNGEARLPMYVISGSGGNLSNCIVRCTKNAYTVSQTTLTLPSSLKIQSSVSPASYPVLASVYSKGKIIWPSVQDVEINFNAAAGLGGVSPLFYAEPGTEVCYPDTLTLTAGISGSNINKVAIGSSSSGPTHRFRSPFAINNYYNALSTGTLSVMGSMNANGGRVLVDGYGENDPLSYGVDGSFYSADVIAGVTLGDINTRPQDMLCNGRFVFYTSGQNFFYSNPSYLGYTSGVFPNNQLTISKIDYGCAVDVNPYNAFSSSGEFSINLTANTEVTVGVGPNSSFLFVPRYNYNYELFALIVLSNQTVYLNHPFKQVNLAATGGASNVLIDLDPGIRPNDVIRFTNVNTVGVISGNFTLPSQPTVPFSLNPGTSVVVTVGWDNGATLRTMIVT